MARAHAYFFYGSDTSARDAALEAHIASLSPRFVFRCATEKPLGIEDAHEIGRKAQLSVGDQVQVFVVSQADRMTREASEALLKLLEEPPPGSVFCLVADSPDIPSTLLSRLSAQSFFTMHPSGMLERFETRVRSAGRVSRESANQLRRQVRIDTLRVHARINAQSLVEFEEICHE